MKIIRKSKEINLLFKNIKKSGFVPTMGSLHKGHEYLIKKSITENKITVVSIFLNPKQFNNKNDLKKYPKKINDDIRICKKLKVNYLFIPSFNEIYSWKSKKRKYPKINKIMEHKYRKGHFKGVLQVIEKLTDIVPSSKMYLGEKDFQQLKIIKDFIFLNKIKTKIINCKTIRDSNGLALSSRNQLLNKANKKRAALIINFVKKIKKKKSKTNNILKDIKENFKKNKIKYDYIENINLKTFKITDKINNQSRLFVAFYLGKVRLIDNI
jgi:pantoate--beta-alanine ligase